jgi:hypothetical protein
MIERSNGNWDFEYVFFHGFDDLILILPVPHYRTGFTVPKRLGSHPRCVRFDLEMCTPTVSYFFHPLIPVPRFRPLYPPYQKHGNYGGNWGHWC